MWISAKYLVITYKDNCSHNLIYTDKDTLFVCTIC